MRTVILLNLMLSLVSSLASASSVSLLVVDADNRPLSKAETSVRFHSGAG